MFLKDEIRAKNLALKLRQAAQRPATTATAEHRSDTERRRTEGTKGRHRGRPLQSRPSILPTTSVGMRSSCGSWRGGWCDGDIMSRSCTAKMLTACRIGHRGNVSASLWLGWSASWSWLSCTRDSGSNWSRVRPSCLCRVSPCDPVPESGSDPGCAIRSRSSCSRRSEAPANGRLLQVSSRSPVSGSSGY